MEMSYEQQKHLSKISLPYALSLKKVYYYSQYSIPREDFRYVCEKAFHSSSIESHKEIVGILHSLLYLNDKEDYLEDLIRTVVAIKYIPYASLRLFYDKVEKTLKLPKMELSIEVASLILLSWFINHSKRLEEEVCIHLLLNDTTSAEFDFRKFTKLDITVWSLIKVKDKLHLQRNLHYITLNIDYRKRFVKQLEEWHSKEEVISFIQLTRSAYNLITKLDIVKKSDEILRNSVTKTTYDIINEILDSIDKTNKFALYNKDIVVQLSLGVIFILYCQQKSIDGLSEWAEGENLFWPPVEGKRDKKRRRNNWSLFAIVYWVIVIGIILSISLFTILLPIIITEKDFDIRYNFWDIKSWGAFWWENLSWFGWWNLILLPFTGAYTFIVLEHIRTREKQYKNIVAPSIIYGLILYYWPIIMKLLYLVIKVVLGFLLIFDIIMTLGNGLEPH